MTAGAEEHQREDTERHIAVAFAHQLAVTAAPQHGHPLRRSVTKRAAAADALQRAARCLVEIYIDIDGVLKCRLAHPMPCFRSMRISLAMASRA